MHAHFADGKTDKEEAGRKDVLGEKWCPGCFAAFAGENRVWLVLPESSGFDPLICP